MAGIVEVMHRSPADPGLHGEASATIDATSLVVAPGFVDIHTHYDGQVSWDSLLEPSSGHGVTTPAGARRRRGRGTGFFDVVHAGAPRRSTASRFRGPLPPNTSFSDWAGPAGGRAVFELAPEGVGGEDILAPKR